MISLHSVVKTFGSNRAVDGVSLAIGRGEIVALVGENGAGKTTLMRIVAGELEVDGGSLQIDGKPLLLRSPRDAAAQRIELVHQHFMLVNELTIAENLALASRAPRLVTTKRSIERDAERVIAASGIELRDPSRRVAELSVGEKSKLELIKAIARSPRLLILDEPTAVLAPAEAAELFQVIRRLAATGTAVVFISHKLPEVLEIAQRVVVLRRGKIVAESTAEATGALRLADAMMGGAVVHRVDAATPASERPREPSGAKAALVLDNLVTASSSNAVALDGVSLAIARGEIVAVIGVAGNGQSALAYALRGLAPIRRGRIFISGRAAAPRALLHTLRVGHIPEDRTHDGLVAEMTIAENVSLAERRWRKREAHRRTARLIELYTIRASGPEQRAGDLSGGNQQKVILARELDRTPEVIVAAEPTRGLDIGATRFVHEQLRAAAARGAAILLITSDLDEAFVLSDALHVMYRGKLSRRLDPHDASLHAGAMMAGLA